MYKKRMSNNGTNSKFQNRKKVDCAIGKHKNDTLLHEMGFWVNEYNIIGNKRRQNVR